MENSSTANELLWVEQQRADQAQTEFQHLEWRKRFALLLGLIALALTFATLLANLGAAGAIQSPASRAVPASTHEESPALTAPRHLTLGGHPAAAGVPPNSRRKASRPEWAEQMARLARLVHQG